MNICPCCEICCPRPESFFLEEFLGKNLLSPKDALLRFWETLCQSFLHPFCSGFCSYNRDKSSGYLKPKPLVARAVTVLSTENLNMSIQRNDCLNSQNMTMIVIVLPVSKASLPPVEPECRKWHRGEARLVVEGRSKELRRQNCKGEVSHPFIPLSGQQ